MTICSCKRNTDQLTTDPQAKLAFSSEKISFDTVFTSVGSISKRLWVYNDNKHAVNISSIQLGRLYSSSYKITVDGEELVERYNYELKGRDSMLMLVKVFIDPQNQSLPYLVDDSIVFTTNGNIQVVDLLAYGQDAFFLTNTSVPCNTTWTNTKPYVLSGNVVVPAGCTLTIDKGTRIRLHKDATLTVAGTLITQGDKDSIITFKHDNLSALVENLPGQWGGIIFETGSKNNLISYTEIKNATTALKMEAESDGDTIAEVRLENSMVLNSAANAIVATHTDFYGVNSLVTNATGYLFQTFSGGNYYFDFCTFSNYSYEFFRNSSSFRVSNSDLNSSNDLAILFRNSIVWGDKTEEFEQKNNGTNGFSVRCKYSILKTNLNFSNDNSLFNVDPKFEDPIGKKFTLQTSSPAINTGITIPSVTIDLKGTARDATPDRGCYEKQ